MVAQGDGGNCDVRVGKSVALLLPIAAQQTGLPGDFRRDGQVFQAVQKGRGSVLFTGPEAGLHLGEVYRATSKHMPLIPHKLIEEFSAAKPPV